MKIFVSKESFKDLEQFEIPMEAVGICIVDESLRLGQVIIEANDGKRYLIGMSEDGTQTVKKLQRS